MSLLQRGVPKWAEIGAGRIPLKDYVQFLRPYKAVNSKNEKVTVKPSFQTHALKELLEGPRNEFVCIAGTKTETMPAYLATTVLKKYEKQRHQVNWIPMRVGRMPLLDESDIYFDSKFEAAVFYNILPDASIYRIEKLRDCLDLMAYRGIMRIIVVAGMDPYAFCVERLRINPDCGIYIESNI